MTFTYLFFQKIRLLNSQGVFPLKLLKKISGSFYRCLIFKVRRSLSFSLVRGSLLYITLPRLSSTFFKLFSLFPKSFLKALFLYLPLAECPDIIPKLPPLVNPLFWFFLTFFEKFFYCFFLYDCKAKTEPYICLKTLFKINLYVLSSDYLCFVTRQADCMF